MSEPLLVGGQWRITSQTQTIINPYTGKPVREVCLADTKIVEEAVVAAQQGYKDIAALPAYKRAAILEKLAAGLQADQAALAQLITEETGKPITDSMTEVARCVATFKFAASEALNIGGEVVPMETMPIGEGRIGFTRRLPIGVVLGIAPFNFPINLSAHKMAPAFAAGNSLILKPPPQAPAVCLRLGKIALEAGVPPKALSVLPCPNDLAEDMARDERIAMISFTGSAKVGWHLKNVAGKKRVVLELGGNAGVVIAKDADIAWAVKRCVRGAFVHAGQTCISVQRIYVHALAHRAFVKSFLSEIKKLKSGDPSDPQTFLGPMLDKGALDKAEKLVQEAVRKGARVLCGGKRKDPFFEATVLENAPADCGVVCEEAFSPVAVLDVFEDFDDALRRLNATRFGLQAGIFTENLDMAMKAASTVEAGAVIINDVPTYRVDSMPYGGIKDSGFGREGLRYAVESMTEPRLIVLNTKRSV